MDPKTLPPPIDRTQKRADAPYLQKDFYAPSFFQCMSHQGINFVVSQSSAIIHGSLDDVRSFILKRGGDKRVVRYVCDSSKTCGSYSMEVRESETDVFIDVVNNPDEGEELLRHLSNNKCEAVNVSGRLTNSKVNVSGRFTNNKYEAVDVSGRFTLSCRSESGIDLTELKLDLFYKEKEKAYSPLTSTGTFSLSSSSNNSPTLMKIATSRSSGANQEFTRRGKRTLITCCEVVPATFASFYEGEALDERRISNWMVQALKAPPLTEEELALKDSVVAKVAKHTQWNRIKSSLNSTAQKFTSSSGGGNQVWGKATTKIDCSALQALAWIWHLTTYERLKIHVAENGTIPRFAFLKSFQPHSLFSVVAKRFPLPFKNRVFYARQIWWLDEEAETYYMCYFPEEVHNIEFGAGHQSHDVPEDFVKAFASGLFTFKSLNKNVCEYTHHVHVDAGGILPQRLIDYKLSANLDVAIELQLKYHRMPETVDMETREKFCELIMNQSPEEAEKIKILAKENATELLTEREWTPIRSGDPLTTYKYSRTKRGDMTGKAESIVDARPEIVLAWWFDYCSNERMSIHRLSKNIAKLIIKKENYDNQTIATIKALPWPFRKREFVVRQLCWKEDEEDAACYVSSESFSCQNLEVDYGYGIKKVRGALHQLLKFSPVDNNTNQTRVELIQFISSRGMLPKFLENMKFKESLKPIVDARAAFNRDSEIDRENRVALAHLLFEERVLLDDKEKLIVEEVQNSFEEIHPDSFKSVEGTDAYIKLSVSKGRKRNVLKATTLFDGTLEEVSADVFNHVSLKSRDSKKLFFLFGGLFLDQHEVSPGHSTFREVTKIGGGKPQEWVAKCLCLRENPHELTIAVETNEDEHEYPKNNKYERIKGRILLKLKEGVSEVSESDGGGEIAHTNITAFAEFDVMGSVDVHGRSRTTLEFLETSRKKNFDRGDEVDYAQRVRDISEFEKADQEKYSTTEDVTLAHANNLFNLFTESKFKTENGVQVAYRKDKKSNAMWGMSKTVVSADAMECLAFQWNVMSRSSENSDTLVKQIVEKKNNHNFTLYMIKGVHFPKVSNREFMTNFIYKKIGKNEWMLCLNPVDKESPSIKPSKSTKLKNKPQKRGSIRMSRSASEINQEHKVRAKTMGCWIFKGLGEGKTQVKFCGNIEFGGLAPVAVQNFYIRYHMRRLPKLKDYFLQLKRYDELGEEEGEALAEAFTTKTRMRKAKSTSNEEARVIDVVEHYKSMNEVVTRFPWFQDMMIEIMKVELRGTEEVKTALPYLSKLEGRLIGKSLSLQLACNLSPDHAIDSWLLQYPAMITFEKENCWFRPMVVRIGHHILKNVAWGMRARVMAGGFLSFTDLVSDLYMLIRFFIRGQPMYAWVILIMVMANWTFQIMTSYMQSRGKPKQFLKNLVWVFTGTKPVMDAWQVASGEERQPHQLMDPLQNLVMTRFIEVFTECVPGSILQTFAYFKNGHSKAALTSIFLSAMTTAYVTTSISYDLDTDPKKRDNNPRFYGYVPNAPWYRGVAFILLLASNFFYTLSRTVSIALIFLVDINIFLYYTACDTGLFLVYKIVTCDFQYFLPTIRPQRAFVVSLLSRVCVKFVNDFTGCVHLRSPSELGGLYWTLSTIGGVNLTFVALKIYFNSEDAQNLSIVKVNETLVQSFVYCWYISFISLLTLIYLNDRSYLSTFWSVDTAKKSACDEWKFAKTDELKMKIFRKHPSYRKRIEEDVRIWVEENFVRWCEEYFMTEKLLHTIPDYMLPSDAGELFRNARKSNSLFLIKKKSTTLRKISLAEQEDLEEERLMNRRTKQSSAAVMPL
mmetsp:Transcript_23268/g.43719  ORF Transcript_23268/g.43719 Transcript_23268/m.43719 type:complete len:1815 (+) Transcript_23268:166-5610(+)